MSAFPRLDTVEDKTAITTKNLYVRMDRIIFCSPQTLIIDRGTNPPSLIRESGDFTELLEVLNAITQPSSKLPTCNHSFDPRTYQCDKCGIFQRDLYR